jgi:hypothetical protein
MPIVKYKLEDNEKIWMCDFELEEYDDLVSIVIIETFYNRLYISILRQLKSFKIEGYPETEYIISNSENKDTHQLLYNKIYLERKLSYLENDLVNTYKSFIEAKKEYYINK